MIEIVSGLGVLAGRYRTLLCDVWGVVHNGREAFPDACAALARWRDEIGPVILISNAPRPAHDVAGRLDELDVPRATWSAIVTSGDVSRDLLMARAPGPAWRIGPSKDDPLFEGLGLDYAGPESARFIACSGPFDELTETPEDYRESLAFAAGRGLPMICANPDIVVQRGDRLIYCAGALAKLYGELGGEVIEAGKPSAPIYELALGRAAELSGVGFRRAEILVIGDGVATDLAGAHAQGLDALFVAHGVHGAELIGHGGDIDPANLARLTAAAPPAFAISRLVW